MSTAIDRTRRPGQSPLRVPFDFYATPPEATPALLSVEQFDGPIWEPACGDGAISRQLIATGHDVVSIYAIDELVCLPNGDPERVPFMRRADRRYCWMVWKPDHTGAPKFWWLATAQFRNA